LSDTFPVKNSLKQGDILSPLLFKFSSEYAIKSVHSGKIGGLKIKQYTSISSLS